jgi:hypothetical protein
MRALRLSSDHSVRSPDCPGLVTCALQALVGNLCPKVFQFLRRRLVRVPLGFIGGPRHGQSPVGCAIYNFEVSASRSRSKRPFLSACLYRPTFSANSA